MEEILTKETCIEGNRVGISTNLISNGAYVREIGGESTLGTLLGVYGNTSSASIIWDGIEDIHQLPFNYLKIMSNITANSIIEKLNQLELKYHEDTK